jgi:replicative DNA helicase
MKTQTIAMTKETQESSSEVLKKLGFQHIRSAVRQSIAVVDKAKKGLRNVYTTNWTRLNRHLLGGLQPGKLYIIAGRPGTGKSAFSNQLIFDLMDNAAKLNKKMVVFYWSFEMPGYQQIMRSASKDTGKQMSDLYSVDKTLGEQDFQSFMQSVHKYVKYPVFFQNKPKNVSFIESACEKFTMLHPDVQILNLIDHTRLVPGDEDVEMKRLNNLSKGCMRMQANMGTINLLLSQLNRNIEKDDRAKNQFQPMLSDLFGGDSIGQDAHVVMMIQRPHDLYGITARYCGEDPRGLLALHLEKNRDGILGMIPYDFDGAKFTITERKSKSK